MSTLTSIVVTAQTPNGPQTFDIPLDTNCALVWGTTGWDLLSDYYKDVKKDPAMAKAVKDKKLPKAKDKAKAVALAGQVTVDDPLVALKSPNCEATQWP